MIYLFSLLPDVFQEHTLAVLCEFKTNLTAKRVPRSDSSHLFNRTLVRGIFLVGMLCPNDTNAAIHIISVCLSLKLYNFNYS